MLHSPKNSLIIECELDAGTLEVVRDLRRMRLEIAKKQLADAEDTISELLVRGLIAEGEQNDYRASLRGTLTQKIQELEARNRQDHAVFADEIEFMVSLMDKQSS